MLNLRRLRLTPEKKDLLRIQHLVESHKKSRGGSKSYQKFIANRSFQFKPGDFQLRPRNELITDQNNLRDIYGNLFQTSRVSEFDSLYESHPGVILNISSELKQDESLWHLIDAEKSGSLGFRLHNGAVLRFGKQRVEVKMLRAGGKSRSVQVARREGQSENLMLMANNNYYSNQIRSYQERQVIKVEDHAHDEDDHDEDDDRKCWICLEGESENRPFAKNICKCSKNMTRHVDCLIEWLSKKCERSKMGFITFYDFSRMVCDICKDQFPSVIQYKDKKKMFIDFDPNQIQHPFMVLNVYKIDDNSLKGVAVAEFKRGGTDQARRVNKNPNVITYGRNEKNDINFKGRLNQTFPCHATTASSSSRAAASSSRTRAPSSAARSCCSRPSPSIC